MQFVHFTKFDKRVKGIIKIALSHFDAVNYIFGQFCINCLVLLTRKRGYSVLQAFKVWTCFQTFKLPPQIFQTSNSQSFDLSKFEDTSFLEGRWALSLLAVQSKSLIESNIAEMDVQCTFYGNWRSISCLKKGNYFLWILEVHGIYILLARIWIWRFWSSIPKWLGTKN